MSPNEQTIALITGGSRGLGRSMAEHLAKRGVGVIITYRDRADAAAEVVSRLKSAGQKSVALQLDAADSSSFSAFAERVRGALTEHFAAEQLDYLVNNAGTGLHAAFLETTEAQFDDLMRIHVKGPFFLTQKLAPLMRDGGRILNLSSGLARFTLPGYAAYATMKGAIEVLTRYQAKEFGGRQIAVNTLAPGAIETDFGGGVVRDNAQVNAMIASQTAMGRVGLPDDIGAAVSMLLAPELGWMTGQRLELSGGQGI